MGFLFYPKRQHWQSLKANNPETKAGCYSTDALSRRFVNAIKEARADGINLPPKFIAKKLRHSFFTAMRSVEPDPCDYHDLQAYCGHEPDNTMAKHYDKPSLERLEKIAALAQEMVFEERAWYLLIRRLYMPVGEMRTSSRTEKRFSVFALHTSPIIPFASS